MEVVGSPLDLIRVYLWSTAWPIGNMWPSIQSATVYLKYVPLSLFSLSGPTSACDALNWCFLEPSGRPQWSSMAHQPHTCRGEWLAWRFSRKQNWLIAADDDEIRIAKAVLLQKYSLLNRFIVWSKYTSQYNHSATLVWVHAGRGCTSVGPPSDDKSPNSFWL